MERKASRSPILLVICGPNGAGKSTFYKVSLKDYGVPFVNADEIALAEFGSVISPLQTYEAAALAETTRQNLMASRQSFCFETVLSDPHGAKVAFLAAAREAGYRVIVHFIGLDSPGLSRDRVIQRVNSGGHDVPDEKIENRYPRVLDNLRRLLDVADELTIYDNSSAEVLYLVLARLENGELVKLRDPLPAWIASLDLPSRTTPHTIILR